MAWYPGAVRKRVTYYNTRMTNPRRINFHQAVATSDTLYGYFQAPNRTEVK